MKEPASCLTQESEASRGLLGVTRVSRSQDVTQSYIFKTIYISKLKSDYTTILLATKFSKHDQAWMFFWNIFERGTIFSLS